MSGFPLKLERRWRRNWMRLSGIPLVGPLARRLAAIGLPPLYGAVPLAAMHPSGFISPSARIAFGIVRIGRHCFVGDGVLIFKDAGALTVELGDRVHLHESITIQTGHGGSISIGDDTHIQPRCQLSAYCGKIEIGKRVEVAPACAFYPYNHGMELGTPIREQALYSRKGIVVEDDAWLGYGAILLDGAHIGAGAVVAAGAVVNTTIPADCIAAGVPARVIKTRSRGNGAS